MSNMAVNHSSHNSLYCDNQSGFNAQNVLFNTDNNMLKPVSILSFNMHGYNQGCIALRDIVHSRSPDIIFLQEHWLTPSNLDKFSVDFPGYFSFGASAMDRAVEVGILRGRPYGGVMVLLKHELSHLTQTLCANERLIVIKMHNLLLFNVYFPCAGTVNRGLIFEELCDQIDDWIDKYSDGDCDCECIIGGDLNIDLGETCSESRILTNFMAKHGLQPCDAIFHQDNIPTYINESLGCSSTIDHFLINNSRYVDIYEVLDPHVNFSDHLPILVSYMCNIPDDADKHSSDVMSDRDGPPNIKYLRWDYADILSYYCYTGEQLNHVFQSIKDYDANNVTASMIESIYNDIVNIMWYYGECFVPQRCKSFYKFWWSTELDTLKDNAMQSYKIWKNAGRPRSGSIYDKYRSDKRVYRIAIREHKDDEVRGYSNDLHETLVKKQGPSFWRVWRSKFDNKTCNVVHVDGVADSRVIVDRFANHFKQVCSNDSYNGSSKLQDIYSRMRQEYCGDPYLHDYMFDACLVERIICNMKRGKAAGLDNLTAEHLQNCHSLLPAVLAKLFNLIVLTGHIPSGFRYSYTVPIPKNKANVYSKAFTIDDFRGISISPVISKVFEHCILHRYNKYFVTSDNQFSYKHKLGCTTALHTVRCVVEHYVNNGSTVNLCALDLTKAFDRINHYGLFIKLMNRHVPILILRIIESWLTRCCTCVKWNSRTSHFFKLETGTRQGGVLSPVLFNIYIDDIIDVIAKSEGGCHFRNISYAILIYADDILLLAPTVNSLQLLVDLCCKELSFLDMQINFKKSVCMRIGPRFKYDCAKIVVSGNHELCWVQHCRYLGVDIESASVFKCSFSERKKAFYRSFNCIFGKISRNASAEVIMELVRKKCISLLFYASEVLPFNSSNYNMLDYVINCAIRKIFFTNSNDVVAYCRDVFGIKSAKDIIAHRRQVFLGRLATVDSLLRVIWK